MQKELKDLLLLIKEKVFMDNSEKGDSLSVEDTARLFNLAKKHDFAHLLKEVSGDGEKEAFVNKAIKKERSLALFRFTQQELELESLKNILEYNKIDFIPLKGATIRQFYPEPWMRTSCDIDVLINSSDLKNAEKALLGAGYKKGKESTHDISFFSQNGVHVELHFSLLEDDFKKLSALESALISSKKVEGKTFERRLEEKLFAFYHVYHMAKHFANGGCGIKPFVDLKLIAKNVHVSDKQLNPLFLESGLRPFYNAVQALMGVWFDGEKHTELTSEMEKFILYGGVYGSEKQRVAVQQVKSDGRFKYVLKRIFVGYKDLCLTFPSLKKCPILFPFYQVARWFKLVFGKDRQRIKKTLEANSNVTKEEQQTVKSLAEQLELL